MTKYIRSLKGLYLMVFIMIAVACASEGSTGPKKSANNVEVRYISNFGCAFADTPIDSVKMGIIEFKNNTDSPVVPVEIAVKLVGSTPVSVPMYDFGATYRYADNSIIPNLDAQQDFETSYITFAPLPAIEPGDTFQAMVKGSIPVTSTGLYLFQMIPDSVRAETTTGESVEIKMGLNEFSLRIADDCT